MSSILKALKKLEDEKTIRKPDSLKIDAEILRGDASRLFSPMGTTLLAALIFVCGCGATYVLMKPDTKDIAGIKHPVSTVSPLKPPSSISVVVPVAEKSQLMNVKSEAPKPNKVIPARSELKFDIAPSSSVKSSRLLAKVQPIKQSEVKRPVAPTHPEQTPALHPVAAVILPSLKVNGIAFQNDSADRVAIVNGISVSSGSMIEGAKIEDIHKDRVRFSYGGETFDIGLGKSNP